MGDVPHPASFEKMPRVTPKRIARIIVNPPIPPETDLSEKASLMMLSVIIGIFSILLNIIARQSII